MVHIRKSINMIHCINKVKDKNPMILSTDIEKAINKIQHLFMMTTFSKVGIEGAHLNMIKAIYEKPTDKIMLKRQN